MHPPWEPDRHHGAAATPSEKQKRYAEELRRRQGLDVKIRVGVNSGEVVVRSLRATYVWTIRRWARPRSLEALKRLLLRESLVQPLLLVFEDLHWADAEGVCALGPPRGRSVL